MRSEQKQSDRLSGDLVLTLAFFGLAAVAYICLSLAISSFEQGAMARLGQAPSDTLVTAGGSPLSDIGTDISQAEPFASATNLLLSLNRPHPAYKGYRICDFGARSGTSPCRLHFRKKELGPQTPYRASGGTSWRAR